MESAFDTLQARFLHAETKHPEMRAILSRGLCLLEPEDYWSTYGESLSMGINSEPHFEWRIVAWAPFGAPESRRQSADDWYTSEGRAAAMDAVAEFRRLAEDAAAILGHASPGVATWLHSLFEVAWREPTDSFLTAHRGWPAELIRRRVRANCLPGGWIPSRSYRPCLPVSGQYLSVLRCNLFAASAEAMRLLGQGAGSDSDAAQQLPQWTEESVPQDCRADKKPDGEPCTAKWAEKRFGIRGYDLSRAQIEKAGKVGRAAVYRYDDLLPLVDEKSRQFDAEL
ncbi:hypothetical protein [Botrimarina sp.]|uniref:hypothetical protein n=1 Tax=Botrimarina sp. TaxID=2795802 RepID=UPI0032ECA404